MINMYKILKNHVKSKCSSLRLNKFQRQAKPLWFSRWLPQPHKSIKWIWRKRNYVKVLCWPPPAGWLLLQPSDGTTKAGDLRESDGRGIMSSCSADLLRRADCCSSHLMDKGKQVIRFYHLQHVKLLLLASSSAGVAAPAIWLTTKAGDLRESDGRGIMSSCSAGLLRRADCCSSHLMDKGKQVIGFYHLQHVKLLLLASSSAGVAAPAIWLTTKAGDLRESDGRGIMSSCSAGLLRRADCCSSHLMDKGKQVIRFYHLQHVKLLLLASSSRGRCCSSHLIDNESRWFERIWWKRHHVKLLCWPPPAGWLLLHPSDGQRKASHSILSSAACQVTPAGLVQLRALLLQPSDWQRKQVIWENLMEEASCQVTAAGLVQRGRCCSSHLIDNESRWFERIWWKRHHVKLLCWPRPARSLLFAPSDGQRKASDLRESHGRGIMSSCSAGLVRHGHCCSRHLMDKGKQVIWENLTEEASCQVALLASSSAIVAAPAVWWTGTMNYTS